MAEEYIETKLARINLDIPSLDHLFAMITWAHNHRREFLLTTRQAHWSMSIDAIDGDNRDNIEAKAYVEINKPQIYLQSTHSRKVIQRVIAENPDKSGGDQRRLSIRPEAVPPVQDMAG